MYPIHIMPKQKKYCLLFKNKNFTINIRNSLYFANICITFSKINKLNPNKLSFVRLLEKTGTNQIKFTYFFYFTNTEGSIRLVDGATQYEGRIELFFSGEWGSMCDDGAGTEEAIVACRQLGYRQVTGLNFS